jgi:hypothetical protein
MMVPRVLTAGWPAPRPLAHATNLSPTIVLLHLPAQRLLLPSRCALKNHLFVSCHSLQFRLLDGFPDDACTGICDRHPAMNSYTPLGGDSLPQGYQTGAPLPPPIPTYPVSGSISSSAYSQWAPLDSHNQGGYLSGQVVQIYGNTTASYGNAFTGHQMSLFLEPTPNNTFPIPQQVPISVSTDANVQSMAPPPSPQPMAPPPNPRKRKAPTLREEDWDPVKARIIELHITQNVPLAEVKRIVEQEFKLIGFTAT